MNTTNKKLKNQWFEYACSIQIEILTKSIIKKCLTKFWNEIVSKINQIFWIQFKIKKENGEYRSISYLQTVSKAEFKELLNVLLEFWDIQSEEYHKLYVKNVIFLYKVLPDDTTVKKNKNKSACKNKTGRKYNL